MNQRHETIQLHDDTYYILRYIEKQEEELVWNKMMFWMYQREYDNPVHIGKDKAEENKNIHQKRIKYLEENIQAARLYAIEHNLLIQL